MSAPIGNQFWLERSSHGRNPKFETHEDLWGACCEYFQWVEENPLYESKPFSFQGASWLESIPKMRAMTKAGLCFFLHIDETTLNRYKERSDDFRRVVEEAEQVIYQQKFAGAAADLLNPNIIARDLGLKDKSDVDHGLSDPLVSLLAQISGKTLDPK